MGEYCSSFSMPPHSWGPATQRQLPTGPFGPRLFVSCSNPCWVAGKAPQCLAPSTRLSQQGLCQRSQLCTHHAPSALPGPAAAIPSAGVPANRSCCVPRGTHICPSKPSLMSPPLSTPSHRQSHPRTGSHSDLCTRVSMEWFTGSCVGLPGSAQGQECLVHVPVPSSCHRARQ